VVGVVGDVKYRLNWDPFPEFYVPYAQYPNWYQVVVLQTAIEPASITPAVREAFRAVDPDVPVVIEALQDRISRSSAVTENRFRISILGCLSGLAALLAVVGIYGVLAYTVSQRSHEIGIRMALGAGKSNVVLSVLTRGLVMAGLGLGIGWAVALAASRVVESLLFAVSPTDPETFAVVALLVAAATIAASTIPAFRATRVNPVVALKQE
jgi:putative ABC transport system permease protein